MSMIRMMMAFGAGVAASRYLPKMQETWSNSTMGGGSSTMSPDMGSSMGSSGLGGGSGSSAGHSMMSEGGSMNAGENLRDQGIAESPVTSGSPLAETVGKGDLFQSSSQGGSEARNPGVGDFARGA